MKYGVAEVDADAENDAEVNGEGSGGWRRCGALSHPASSHRSVPPL